MLQYERGRGFEKVGGVGWGKWNIEGVNLIHGVWVVLVQFCSYRLGISGCCKINETCEVDFELLLRLCGMKGASLAPSWTCIFEGDSAARLFDVDEEAPLLLSALTLSPNNLAWR